VRRKSEIRNPKLAKPEPKKLKTESWQKNGGKNMELPKVHPNCARFGKDEAKQIQTERNPKQRGADSSKFAAGPVGGDEKACQGSGPVV
jgi:hypothetical protein